jgi:hypothetical protein
MTARLHAMREDWSAKANFAAAVMLLLFGATSIHAQTFPTGTIEYSAKILCGNVPSTGSSMVLPTSGSFKTSVNIHNPALPTTPLTSVTFEKKAVQAIQEPPAGVALPSPGALVTDTLKADFAEEVDCTVIKKTLLPQPPPVGFFEGWVVIYSLPTVSSTGNTPNPLDVESVFTNGNGAIKILPAMEHDF